MIFNDDIILEGYGISLKPLDVNDAPQLHTMMSDPYLCDKAGLMTHTHISQTIDFILSTNNDVNMQRQLLFGIFNDDTLVGIINLFNIDYKNKSGEYGYFIGSEFTRQGYMRKSITLLSNYLLEHTFLASINIYVDTTNKASLGLVKKMGFHKKEQSIQEDMSDRSVEMIRFEIKDKISD